MISENHLLPTKTSLPAHRKNLLVRRRLTVLVEQGLSARLTTVIAPAGSGKTTALGQWLHATGRRTAWVWLDELDNDFARFWRYVLQAMTTAAPALADRLGALARQLPGMSVHTFLDAVLSELAALPEPLVIVLDDYHRIDDRRIHDSLVYVIGYLPDSVRLILCGRSELPFSVARWRMEGQLCEIGGEALQFTPEETLDFCRQASGLPLTASHAEKLFRRTEGWAAGLQLVSISLRTTGDYDRYIDGFGGFQRHVADYLFHEVMAKLPSELHLFLLQTSVLDRLDETVCNAVAQRKDSRELLMKLKAMNLFLLPLDETDGWFRYHHLFSDFLRGLVRRNHARLWSGGHLAASRSFASRGLMDEAIDHALAGEDYPLATDLLERHAGVLFGRGEYATLLRRFEAVQAHAALSPGLALMHAFMLVVTGRFDRAAALLERIERVHADEAEPGQRDRVSGGLLFVKSNLVFYSGDYEQWFRFAEKLQTDRLPADPVFYNFNYNVTEPLVRRTAFGLKGMLTPDTEAIARQFSAVLEPRGWKDSLINLYVNQSLCEGYYEWNRLDDGDSLIRKIERADRFDRVPGLFVPNRLTQARLHAARGKWRAARETIGEAIRTMAGRGEYGWIRPLRAGLARLCLLEGDANAAKEELDGIGLHAGERPTPDRLYEFLVLCRLLGVRRKEAEALRLLELMKPLASRENLLSDIAEIAIMQALLEAQSGQGLAARQTLHEALAIGEANGYVRSFLDEGKPMASLLDAYIREIGRNPDSPLAQGVSGAYVRGLLERFPGGEERRSAAAAPVEPLTGQELSILGLIGRGISNRGIAEALGLTEGTVKVYLSRLYAKLGVASRTQALAAARELRLLEQL